MGVMRSKTTNYWVIGSPCGKCNATGIVMRHLDYAKGVCFDCGGSGVWQRSKKGFRTSTEAQLHENKLDHDAKLREARRTAKYQADKVEREAAAAERAAVYAAEQAERAAAAAADRASVSYHPAEVGTKIELTGVVGLAINIEGQYGTQRLVLINGNDGHVYKTISTAMWAYQVERGEQIMLAAEIKGFAEYDGYKQTVIKRPKLIAA